VAEARTARYFTWDGKRRSVIPHAHASSDAQAIAYGKAHDAWNVVYSDGPLSKATERFVWKRS
jgi:hypothetical protein